MSEPSSTIPAAILAGVDPTRPDWPTVVARILAHFRSETVTIHRKDPARNQLELVAADRGLPPSFIETIRSIAIGKGMAGVAAAERRPVTSCNLEQDAGKSSDIRPGARQSGMKGAVVVPMELDSQVVGTLGIGTMREHEYTAAEVADLSAIAREIGRLLSTGPVRSG